MLPYLGPKELYSTYTFPVGLKFSLISIHHSSEEQTKTQSLWKDRESQAQT